MLNSEVACCTLRETREGLGMWPRPPALGKFAEEDIYTINRKLPNKHLQLPGASFNFLDPSGGVFKMDRRRLKGRGAYCYNCTTQQNLFRQKNIKSLKIA